MSNFHTPVLLQEVIGFLDVRRDKKYIDATIGGGGHGFEILRSGGRVLGIDLDQEAIEHVKKILRDKDIKIVSEKKDTELNISISEYPNITLVRGNFREIEKIARLHGFEKVSGILFDLGVSSYQLENPKRGFSFSKEGPLDMRMDPSGSSGQVTAGNLVHVLQKGELYDLYRRLGEERYAHTISEAIVRARAVNPITTTSQLAKIVAGAIPTKFSKINKATRVFQALRIAVNNELGNVREALPAAVELLENGGRLLVISFHSLEDRIVKNTFKEFVHRGIGKIVTKKPVVPERREMEQNKRSRSSKLRVFEKF